MLDVINTKGDVLTPSTYLHPQDAHRDIWIIHGCNAQGVMGSGLARQVKEKFPKAFKEYRKEFEVSGGLSDAGKYLLLGKISIARGLIFDINSGSLTIVNAITQFTYGSDPRIRYTSYDAIDIALDNTLKRIKATGVRGSIVIAIPKNFASDRGNADWGVVKKLIKSKLKASNLFVTLYIVDFCKDEGKEND